MKHIAYSFLILIITAMGILPGCKSDKKTFEVIGTFSSVQKEDTLYLEHLGLSGIEPIDSVKLNPKGTFKFKVPAPKNPEFYQLRLDHQVAIFAVDSTETLRVTGDANDLFNTFRVENSPVNDQIREINHQYRQTVKEIEELAEKHKEKSIDDVTYLSQLDSIVNEYKTFTSKIILGNPGSAAAYYAVFQKIDDYLIFDPYDKKDYVMFGAVATSWQHFYPETPRNKHLYDFTINAMKMRKQQEQQAQLWENIPIVTESSLPDVVLPDVNNNNVALSSLKGNVVLLDFTVYNSDFSPEHNLHINTIYRRYKNRGFEVYQISFDSDEHIWKNAAINVPWITVRDPQSVYSPLLSQYNVRNLPTGFIVDREGDIVARIEDYTKLESELNKVW
jgi:glutathione peroxidase-family protein